MRTGFRLSWPLNGPYGARVGVQLHKVLVPWLQDLLGLNLPPSLPEGPFGRSVEAIEVNLPADEFVKLRPPECKRLRIGRQRPETSCLMLEIAVLDTL